MSFTPKHLQVLPQLEREVERTGSGSRLHRIRGGAGEMIYLNIAHRFLIAGSEPPPTLAFLPPTDGLRPEG